LIQAPAARASVLVYEGFDVTGGVDGTTLSGKAGATSTGFDSGSSWSVNLGVVGASSATYETTGLTFSDVPVRGGRAHLIAGGGSANSSADGARPLDVAATGTIYGSYLIHPVAIPDNTQSINSILVGSQASVTNNDAGAQWDFQVNSDVYGSDNGGGRINGTTGAGDFANTGTPISVGTTYLVLYEMQNLVNSGSASQTLTEWILTASQYDNFKSGGLTETELNGATVGPLGTNVLQRGSQTASLSANLTNADYFHIFSVLADANSQYDELRISNASLNEAVWAPEPSCAAMLFASAALVRLGRRRRAR
jgi:hypothetical protein